MQIIKKLINKIMRQRGDPFLWCYEVAILAAFRNSLTIKEKTKFDAQWVIEDEAHRSPDNKIVYFFGLIDASGATLKTHPLSIRVFGNPSSGSHNAATIELFGRKNPNKNLKVEVVYYDGIGPTLYFDKDPSKILGNNEYCSKVGKNLDSQYNKLEKIDVKPFVVNRP